MAINQIPITYFVNAQAVLPSRGLEPLQLGTILLLTDELPITPQSSAYTISRTASGIINAYGSDSKVAELATAIFSQQPNILAAGGYVIVAPYLVGNQTQPPLPETAGTLTTIDLATASNISNLQEVSDGVLNLSIDGADEEITGLDFGGTTTLQEIAAIIQAKLETVTITVTEDNQLVFTSNTEGATSSVTISEKQEDTEGTDLYGANYLDGADATVVTGKAETPQPNTPETLSQAINRLSSLLYFEGIINCKQISDDEYVKASNLVQAYQNRILFVPQTTTDALKPGTGLFYKLQANSFTKCLLYTLGNSFLEGLRFAAAYASRGLSVDYSGSNTTITMNLKDLAGIQADSNITENILFECENLGVDCFPSVEGLAKVVSNGAPFYFDQIANQIWFISSIQIAYFNVLATTRTKVSQTESGIQKLVNAVKGICRQGVINGMLAPGTWNSPDTFGNYDDFMRNIEEFGYYEYHQPIAQQLQAEREQRKAPTMQIAAKEAGAVHKGNILVYIEP